MDFTDVERIICRTQCVPVSLFGTKVHIFACQLKRIVVVVAHYVEHRRRILGFFEGSREIAYSVGPRNPISVI